MDFDPQQAIELLVSSAHLRSPREQFPYEREIRLCQFQTWIYFPDTALDVVRLVGSLMAVKHLNELYRKHFLRHALISGMQLALKNRSYAKLFEEAVGDYGSWTELVLVLEESFDFDTDLRERIEKSETVCKMIDYRFRYLDHGGPDNTQANISHSEFFRWKCGSKLSWKTIRGRWSRNRRSAVFLYVSEGLGLRLSPSFDGVGFFSSDIAQDARNERRIHRFFGTCAYIMKTLKGENGPTIYDDIHIPSTVRRIRPTTDPLPASELQKMTLYKSEREEMLAS